jgi:hypothetical protein
MVQLESIVKMDEIPNSNPNANQINFLMNAFDLVSFCSSRVWLLGHASKRSRNHEPHGYSIFQRLRASFLNLSCGSQIMKTQAFFAG